MHQFYRSFIYVYAAISEQLRCLIYKMRPLSNLQSNSAAAATL